MADDPSGSGWRRADPRLLVAVTLVVTLGLVAVAWRTVDGAVERAVDDRFARLVTDTTTQVDERLTAVETAVVATRGLLDGSDDVTDVELSRFTDALSLGRPLAERFPGLTGLAVADTDGEVVFTTPANAATRDLADAALDSDTTDAALQRATELALPVTALGPDPAAGLVIATARYGSASADAPTATTDLRRSTLLGHTVGLVDPDALLAGILDTPAATALSLETNDGRTLSTTGDLDTVEAVRDRRVVLNQLGRAENALLLHVWAAPGALGGTDPAPLLVVLLGVPLAGLLATLVWLLATQRERALREVEAATARLAHTNHELEQSNSRLRDFAGVVAHDLRGPLTSIQGMAGLLDMLVGDELGEREADIVARIQRSTAAMAELIGDVLRYAESGVTPTDLEEVDLGLLVSQVLERMDATIGEDDTVDVDVAGSVHVDPTGVRRVLANVIGNALKHGRSDGRAAVSVRSRRDGDRIVVEVTDDGPGIPADQRVKVLEPFQRGPTSARGSGLGLAISNRIVIHHEGTFTLDEAPSGGSLVRFDLPAA